MCRSIKRLRNPEQPPTAEDLHAAALQYVRKISGFHKPSAMNQQVFDRAVAEIAEVSHRLLAGIEARNRAAHKREELHSLHARGIAENSL